MLVEALGEVACAKHGVHALTPGAVLYVPVAQAEKLPPAGPV
tara:strand:+ start:1204 stop:1329 length:126 start_codon:yes stop_codon:yes gene_type:complete